MAVDGFTTACLWGQTRPGFAGAMAMALRSVRGIFRHVHAATKNDPFLSAADGGGNQEGAPAPSWTLPGTVGRGTGADASLRAGDEGRGTGADASLRARDEGRGTACERFAAHAGDEGRGGAYFRPR